MSFEQASFFFLHIVWVPIRKDLQMQDAGLLVKRTTSSCEALDYTLIHVIDKTFFHIEI